MKPIVLVGALDTKGAEFRFVQGLLHERGLEGAERYREALASLVR